jgi:hypothetical protein
VRLRRAARRLALAATAAWGGTVAAAVGAAPLDTHHLAVQAFGNDAPWYEERIPFFESADPLLDRIYYYRWQVFRAHQRDLGARGFISTEFLNDVGWQREPYASLNDATGFHLGEGRWLRDRRYADDYVDYMLTGGDDRHFSDYIADAVWGRYLVDGDRAEALRHLGALRYLYGAWDDHYDWTKGLYWIEPLLDATEYTISSIDASGGKDGFRGGDAFRPSINSYMFAQARALSRLSALAGNGQAADEYGQRAEAIRARVEQDLWNPALAHFTDRYKVDNAFVHYWQPIRGRELVGYLPWTFDLPADDLRFAAAWRHLLDPAELGGPAGLRTVEPSYQYYMRQYRYEGTHPECQWNGPVWPFQTTQALAGLVNLLDHYHQSVVTRGDFLRLLRQYAALHLQNGTPDLEEDYDPATGRPIVGLARSPHYFHSGFVDLMLTGVVGIRPRADDALELHPLLPAVGDPQALAWFRAERIPYHGHLVAVQWDATGNHYHEGAGLRVEVDGRTVARQADLARLVVPLPRRENAPVARPIDLAVQLAPGTFPKPSASGHADPAALHAAIDGRLWFFPEEANGWTSAPSAHDQWFAVDWGRPVSIAGAQIAFFADNRSYAPPIRYRLQYRSAGGWRDMYVSSGPVMANGVVTLPGVAARSDTVRLLFDAPPGASVRLVELKLFKAGGGAAPATRPRPTSLPG